MFAGIAHDQLLLARHYPLAERMRQAGLPLSRPGLGEADLALEELPVAVDQRHQRRADAEQTRGHPREPVERFLRGRVQQAGFKQCRHAPGLVAHFGEQFGEVQILRRMALQCRVRLLRRAVGRNAFLGAGSEKRIAGHGIRADGDHHRHAGRIDIAAQAPQDLMRPVARQIGGENDPVRLVLPRHKERIIGIGRGPGFQVQGLLALRQGFGARRIAANHQNLFTLHGSSSRVCSEADLRRRHPEIEPARPSDDQTVESRNVATADFTE